MATILLPERTRRGLAWRNSLRPALLSIFRDRGPPVLLLPGKMDPHRLSEERSVEYHRIIAARLRRDANILDNARARVRRWLSTPDCVPPYARRWAEILDGDVETIVAFLTERSELADELRQSSPFAGVLRPDERWRVWRETRDRLTAHP